MKMIPVGFVLTTMIIWSMTAMAQTANTITKDNVTYKASYNEASVVSSPKANGEVTILDKITFDKRELKVTSISDKAFKGNENITEITLPNTIETIGDNAFLMCKNLKKVNIPKSVKKIGSQAFRQTAIEAEASGLMYVDDWLVGCGFIEKDSPQGDGKKVVLMMEPMGSVEVKEGTTGIALGAFDYCEQITSLVIPASVNKICFPIIRGCKSITAIAVHQDNTTFDSRNNCNSIIDSKKDYLMAGCQTTAIPNGVVGIAEKAFDTCTGLTTIVLPSTIKSIGNLAFNNCVNLKDFNIPETVTEVHNATFATTGWFKAQAAGLVCKDGWLFGWKGQKPSGKMVVPSGTRHIASNAFVKCSELKEVVFPEGLKSIGSYAFWGCTNMKKVNIPASVENVSINSFYNTAWYAKLSDGAVYLDGWLLGWKGEKPKKKLTIKDGTKHIGNDVLIRSLELTSVVIPPTITTIGDFAFYYCVNLESVVIPEGVKKLGRGCFMGCKKISNLNIPASVTNIGWDWTIGTAWYGAQPNNEALYLDGWLLGWKGNRDEVNKMEIKSETKGVAEQAMMQASNLTTITIPSSMQYINEDAFKGCDKLIQVNIGDLEAWKRITFGNEDSNPTKFSHSLTVNGQTITSW